MLFRTESLRPGLDGRPGTRLFDQMEYAKNQAGRMSTSSALQAPSSSFKM